VTDAAAREHATTSLVRALRLASSGGRGLASAHVALVIAEGAVPLLGIWLLALLVDAVADGIAARDPALDRVLWIAALAAAAAALGAALRAARAVVGEVHGRRVADHVAGAIQAHAARLDLGAFEDPAFHDTLQRAQQEAPHRPLRVVGGLAGLVQATVTLVAMLVALAAVGWLLPLCAAAAAIPGALARTRHSKRALEWQRARTAEQRESSYLHAVLTSASAAKDVRALEVGGELRARFGAIRARLRGEGTALAIRRSRADAAAQLLANVVLFGCLAALAQAAFAGTVTIGGFVMYAQALQRAQGAFRDLLGAVAGLHEDRLFLAHYFELLGRAPALAAEPPVAEAPRLRSELRLQDLHFSYPGAGTPALAGLDLTIRAGERVALIGPNGAGKSTVVKLVCRLYAPARGALTCDGVDLRRVEPEAWRRRLAVVFQDAVLFEVSVRDNLRFGDLGRGEALAVESAARLCGVDERIAAMHAGYETLLSRRFAGGEELSAGERRKLVLARAAFRADADLLVLDEPTQSLDPLAESLVLERLLAAFAGRTVLLVTHRPAVLRLVDRVCVLERGRVVEDGRPADLARGGGPFAAWFQAAAAGVPS
jgi:ATP-binding cassette subfamily B protein